VWGHNVDESFYAQHQLEHLNLNNNILEEMQMAGSKKTDMELRTVLGCFLFSGDDVDKRIKVLSGGEKARVALAKTIISKANFLMLDEPTNHLDMHSVDLLAEALDKYEGSLILVSHDRYFISKTANKIWEIVDGKIVEFKGGYTEWVEWKERMEKQKKSVDSSQLTVKSQPSTVNRQPSTVNRQPSTDSKDKQKKKLQREFDELEKKIALLKEEKNNAESALADPGVYSDKTRFQEAEKKYNQVVAQLSPLELKYEELFEQLMKLD
jgi:ATP-binding cassette subfamily F protein 3